MSSSCVALAKPSTSNGGTGRVSTFLALRRRRKHRKAVAQANTVTPTTAPTEMPTMLPTDRPFPSDAFVVLGSVVGPVVVREPVGEPEDKSLARWFIWMSGA